MSTNLKFAFFGTPEVAKQTLDILKQAGQMPALIVTTPDARAGRGMEIQESPVAIFAKENDIECIKAEEFAGLEEKLGDFDLNIVVAYGKIIPENILRAPKLGSINIHYSLLPRYRGASPVETAILNGDAETGISIQKMVYDMDAGPIIARKEVAILPDETAPELRSRLITIGGELLVKMLKTPSASGHSPFAGGEKQDESQATFCKKIKKEDGLVNLATESPSELYNKFRAYAHWPRTFFFKNGKRIIITNAGFEDGKFIIRNVLPEGKREISWNDFSRS